jgi:hypothetical protein
MMHRKTPRLLVAVYFSSASLLSRPSSASVSTLLAKPPNAPAGAGCSETSEARGPATAPAFVFPVEYGGRLRTRLPLASYRCPSGLPLTPCSMRLGCAFPLGMPGARGLGGDQPGAGSCSTRLPFALGAGAMRHGASSSVALNSSPSGRRSFSGGPSRGGARGGARGGGRGGGWREELSPSERRVMQKQRRDGTISSDDLAKLTRAERSDRSERGALDRGGGRGALRGESGGRGTPPKVRESKPVPEWVMEKMSVEGAGISSTCHARVRARSHTTHTHTRARAHTQCIYMYI